MCSTITVELTKDECKELSDATVWLDNLTYADDLHDSIYIVRSIYNKSLKDNTRSCKDCRFYKPTDDLLGSCIKEIPLMTCGRTVAANYSCKYYYQK